MKPIRNWLDSIRGGRGSGNQSSTATVRRLSRRDQEAQYTRLFYIAMVAVAGLIVIILGAGALYEYQIKPNAVLAEVNGHEIKRRDYWQYQSVVLYRQARTYESFAQQTTGQQQQQFLQFAAAFDAQRDDVWGSTDVSSATLQEMIDNQLYLDGAQAMGIEVTDEMASQYALNEFAPPDAPLQTPIPSPTMIPERAQMATETANAQATEQSIALGTPVATAIPGTPSASPQATPVVDSTPVASPVAITPATPSATPNLADSLNTANAEYDIFQDAVFDEAHMSEDDYLRLWAKPQVARQLVDAQIVNGVAQTGEQVNAQHILVATQELANQLYEQATGGADFTALAKANSTDTVTQPTGGQLGWFTRLEVDPAFADAAFALEPGQISQPVQTPYGWHIIKSLDKAPDRALNDSQYQLATDDAKTTWLDDQRAAADISNDYAEETPTPTQGSFVPPVNAPTPVPATPIPMTPTPTEPLIGPEPVDPNATVPATPGAATPVPGSATPVATPAAGAATPIATTAVATPNAATPVATPAAG
jgi:parvulin-like peptidyl-prolyl isomerase